MKHTDLVRIVLAVAMLAAGRIAWGLSFELPPPDEAVIGEPQVVKTKYEDTFVDLARRYNVGYLELKLANPDVDPWIPGEGTEVVIPTQFLLPDAPREGIVLNVTEMRMYYYPEPQDGESARVMTFPVGVGRVDWKTPLGETKVVRKAANPTWYPPESIRKEHAEYGDILEKVVPPGPENPLGGHALYLGLRGYLLHGTNQPSGIGMQVTHGCIRMLPEDVSALFELAPVGTTVRIIDEPYKTAWHRGQLYLEVHPPLEGEERFKHATLMQSVSKATGPQGFSHVDWLAAEAMAQAPNGLPQPVPAIVALEEVKVTETDESAKADTGTVAVVDPAELGAKDVLAEETADGQPGLEAKKESD